MFYIFYVWYQVLIIFSVYYLLLKIDIMPKNFDFIKWRVFLK